jgi:peptidyl-prolyl cis-trans isomerase SurA
MWEGVIHVADAARDVRQTSVCRRPNSGAHLETHDNLKFVGHFLRNFMKKVLMCLTLILVATGSVSAQEEPVLVDEVVARVNKDIITLAEYRQAQRELREEIERNNPKDLEAEYQRALKTLLQDLIDTQLLVQKADELGISVEAQINEYLVNVAQQNNVPPSKIDDMIRAMGLEPDQARQLLRIRFLREAVIGREVYPKIFANVLEKDVDQFYQKHVADYTEPSGVQLSEIFIRVDGGRTKGQAEILIKDLANRLRSGADFADLAKQHSDGPSAKDGGGLGWFNLDPRPELGERQQEAIQGKPVGAVTEPIELSDGFRLFRIDARRDKTVKPLNPELRRQITMRIAQERAQPAIKDYIEKLRKDAFVEIAEAYRSKEEGATAK